ncbi:MAG: hypothetical protein QOC95_409, partial [Thermoleophilaceae bacterium]|nr:hypothetical protein [Thermoleophilaceae bacterium]
MGRLSRPRRDAAWNPPRTGSDVTALFAVLVAVPLLIPLLSRFAFLLFILPLLVMAIATPRCLGAARRSPNPFVWRIYAVAAVLGGAASALAAGSVLVPGAAKAAFYLGFGTSLCFLAGLLPFLRRTLPGARMERLVDALLFDAVVVALGSWFVVKPGFEHGDVILTLVFVVDLAALAVAAVPTLVATERADRHAGWWLVGVCAGAAAGDGFVA